MALLEYDLKNWDGVKKYCLLALDIKSHPKTYINEVFSWDYTIYDLLSLAYYYDDDISKAIFYLSKAIEMDPNNLRLKNNLKLMLNKKNNSN